MVTVSGRCVFRQKFTLEDAIDFMVPTVRGRGRTQGTLLVKRMLTLTPAGVGSYLIIKC
jgi:hypothetical protein